MTAHASRLRSGIPCRVADEEPRVGGSHRVYKLIFEDSVAWAARENIDVKSWRLDLKAIDKLRFIVAKRPGLRVPAVYLNLDDRIMYMEWVDGEPVRAWNHQISAPNRHRFLDGLAEFLLQLWTLEVPQKFAEDTDRLYSKWLTSSLDRSIRRTLNKTARWGNAVEYLIMRAMIPDYTAGLEAYPLAFAHGDMNGKNVVRAKDYEFTGVIDWDWMFVAPLPAVVHHPWFLADIPGWHNHEDNSDSCELDRAYLENAIEKKELLENRAPTVANLLRNSGARLFFQSAFHFRNIYEQFVRMHCPRTPKNIQAALRELDSVMQTYPELKAAGLELKCDMEKMTASGKAAMEIPRNVAAAFPMSQPPPRLKLRK